MRLGILIVIMLSASAIVGTALRQPSLANATQAQLSQTAFFQDNFNRSIIDSTKWNSTFATSGLRWCSSTIANHHSTPGLWQDPSITPCMGITQNPPFGTISVGGGQTTFGSSFGRTFPYIWSGQPSTHSPFPASGNFILEVKMRYNSVAGFGDGFFVNSWNNTDPVGNNPPNGQQRVFLIWADSSGLAAQLLGNQTFRLFDEFGTHDYILEYVNGQYSLFVDGFLALGPIASNARANAIWVGNPVLTWWGVSNWSSFTLNLVSVTVPSIQISPSSGPIGTKVLVQGSGIPSPQVEVTFDDMFSGFATVSMGNFSFTLDVPDAAPGLHQIKAVEPLSGPIAIANFQVVPSAETGGGLLVSLQVGTIYFPRDTAVVYVLTSQGGALVGPTGLQLQVSLVIPNGSKISLNPVAMSTGLFSASYTIPKTGPLGTYAIVAAATFGGVTASALQTFEVKLSWLSSQAPAIGAATAAILGLTGLVALSWRKGHFSKTAERWKR